MPRGINQMRRHAEQRQKPRAEELAGLGGEPKMEHDDVSHAEEIIKRNSRRAARFRYPRNENDNALSDGNLVLMALVEGLMIRWRPSILTPSGNELGVNGRGLRSCTHVAGSPEFH
jgi:hypothetical protein